MTKPTTEQDRTILAERWAQAVADLDAARDELKQAEKREAEAWEALQRSRLHSVPSED